MNPLTQLPILSLITYIPLLGALAVIFLIPKEKTATIKAFATLVVVIDFVVSLPLWWMFERGRDGYQFVEKASWIPTLGVNYHFGIDGISLILLLLTTLMSRNPGAAKDIRGMTLLGLVLIESLVLYALLICFLIYSK